MSLVFVFTATKMEGSIVERMMRAKTRPPGSKATAIGEIGDNQIVLVTTGMGPHNARAAACRSFQELTVGADRLQGVPPIPDAAIITGLAGSLVPWIREGDLVVYQNCLSSTGSHEPIASSAQIVESMTRSLAIHGLPSRQETGISSPRIVQHDRDRDALAKRGATVVDMESYEIAACSAAAGVPVATMRAISDSPGSRMPDLNHALTPRGEFDRWALASVLATSPLATARLFKASRRAIAALERALDAILSKELIGINLAQLRAGHSTEPSQIQK